MKIKFPVILGFQLIIVIALATLGTFYINKLSKSSANIVKDNLRSLRYCAAMQNALHAMLNADNPVQAGTEFENNMKAEKNNITEPGEKELADKIEAEYKQWRELPTDSLYEQLINSINLVNELNIAAIEKKNESTQQVAQNASVYIIASVLGGVVTILITFFFIGLLIEPPGLPGKNS